MTRYALLDTSVVISAMGAGEVEELPYDVLVVSALSYAELRLGLVTATDMDELRRRIRRIEAISRVFGPGIPFDDACAREYERVVQAAVDHGQRPRTNAVDRMDDRCCCSGPPHATTDPQRGGPARRRWSCRHRDGVGHRNIAASTECGAGSGSVPLGSSA